jgi:transcriptional regulator with XRE-family HTH domain
MLLPRTLYVRSLLCVKRLPGQRVLTMRLFGEKLRYLRRQHNLTQTDLARLLELAGHAYLSNLERGRYTPSLDLVVCVAEALGVTTDYLLRDDLPVQPPISYPEIDRVGASHIHPLFGAKLRHLRKLHHMLQAELATQVGLLRHATISNLEAGRRQASPELVVRIAARFGVTTDYLLRDTVAVESVEPGVPEEGSVESTTRSL